MAIKRFLGAVLLGLVLAALLMQGVFALKVLALRWIDPSSTAFQRAEYSRLLLNKPGFTWKQRSTPYERINDNIKRAVIASEDASFVDHEGVDWEAIEAAWESNNKGKRIKGGSTITQQLAKNLYLTGERNYARKAEELAITYLLEAMLDKDRILELYLNNVEWGEGVFGIAAAAQHYFKTDASKLSALQAARLAVMLPRPRFFEKRPNSAYIERSARTITRRMVLVDLP